MLSTKLFGAALVACLALPSVADTPAPGWQLSTAPKPVFGAATATLPGGDIVTYDGLSVDRWTANGAFVANLATFAVFGFPSFCLLRPNGIEVVVGESSQQNIFRVPLSGTGAIQVANVFFNFDGVFESNNALIVSAATGGFGTGNDLVRVNLVSGAVTPVANLAGASGPVTFDTSGNLLYATQDPNFPAAPGSTDILRWTSAQLQSGVVLSEADAQVVGTGFDGGSSMVVDPVSGALYLAETNFGLASYRVLRVGATQAASQVVAVADQVIGGLELVFGPGPASFEAFQPANGVNLKYSTTDFATFDDTVRVRPKRPTLTISGPGTTGVGPFTLAVDGALPNAGAFLLFQSQGTLLANEATYPFFGFLLHSKFVPGQIRRIQFPIATDAQGHGEVTFFNAGAIGGLFGWQAWVTNSNAIAIGATPVVTF